MIKQDKMSSLQHRPKATETNKARFDMAKPIKTNNPMDSDNFDILPSNGMVAGEQVSQWAQDWWTASLQQSALNLSNPDWDSTGSFESAVNSPGSGMYFLAGSWGNDPQQGVIRDIGDQSAPAVTAGTPIFIPVLCVVSSQWRDAGDKANFNNMSLKDWKTNVDDVFLKIDGQSIDVKSDLVRTKSFSAGPAVAGTVGEYLMDPATGNVETLKATGYYSIVTLSGGREHTIEFGGSTSGSSPTNVHVIDHIYVA
ncbi:MAG: hypothetical protein U1E70_27840 [Acetobacteraceae bacterium]